MAYTIGNISVPEIAASGAFPIVPEFPYGRANRPDVAIHQFGSGNAKIEQRFLLGTGARRFTVRRTWMNDTQRIALRTRLDTEQVQQLALPLADQRLRHDQQNALCTLRPALGNHQARLNRLSQPDLVRENATTFAKTSKRKDYCINLGGGSDRCAPDAAQPHNARGRPDGGSERGPRRESAG